MDGSSVAEFRDDIGPVNIEAEQQLLGAILVNSEVAEHVRHKLRAEQFSEAVHGEIYTAILRHMDKGRIPTPVTLRAEFDDHPDLADAGGAGYLARLAGSTTAIISATDYADVVIDLAARRNLIALAADLTAHAREEHGVEIDEVVEAHCRKAEAAIDDVLSGSRQEVYRVGDIVAETMAGITAIRERTERGDSVGAGLSTGMHELDEKLGLLRPGHLIILGARPGMGKSTMALNIALNVARGTGSTRDGLSPSVLFVTPEMTSHEVLERAFSNEISRSQSRTVPYQAIAEGRLNAVDWQHLDQAQAAIAQLPIKFVDRPGITAERIRYLSRMTAKRSAAQGNALSLIVVDYLGKLGHSDPRARRYDVISQNVAALKDLAKELQVPVLCLAQLSRAVEQRDDKRPILSDLRESGEIEQEADTVAFLYRHEYYLEKSKPTDTVGKTFDDWNHAMDEASGRVEVIIAKRRAGRAGVTAELSANMAACHFSDQTRAAL